MQDTQGQVKEIKGDSTLTVLKSPGLLFGKGTHGPGRIRTELEMSALYEYSRALLKLVRWSSREAREKAEGRPGGPGDPRSPRGRSPLALLPLPGPPGQMPGFF